jgi:hypothetical protein
MDIMINYWAVIGGAIFLFVMGMIWYGPLFGKLWTKIVGAEHMSREEMAAMQKKMMPMYALQVALGLVTSYVLYTFVHMSGLGVMGDSGSGLVLRCLWLQAQCGIPRMAGR